MRFYSSNKKVAILCKEYGKIVKASSIVAMQEDYTNEDVLEVAEIVLKHYKEAGFDYIYTSPPTQNPSLVLQLMKLRPKYRMFTKDGEIEKVHPKRASKTKDVCRVTQLEEKLDEPIYFSWPLNGEALTPWPDLKKKGRREKR